MKKSLRPLALIPMIAGVIAIGSPAYAGSYNGTCESSNGGEICLYDNVTGAGHDINNSGQIIGPLYDTLYSKPDFTGSTYYGTSRLVDNTFESAWNRDPDTAVKMFTNQNYTGSSISTPAGNSSSFITGWSSVCFTSNVSCP
ncbi:peptidase inhibitor family I36 protein [Streptomyces sp. NPDC059866]|uniref:peptidase inhibitor family I36 protein n=1 Tax=Streptomyces sp. NPDC059866 TaxID=3346978 RepID=UPI003665E293